MNDDNKMTPKEGVDVLYGIIFFILLIAVICAK